jgi:hypothetical protein
MQIEVTEKGLKALSNNLRTAMLEVWGPTVPVSNSQSLELLAKTLGYKNWDTLSGVVKNDDKKTEPKYNALLDKTLQSFKPFSLYIDAFAVDEFGEGPGWALVEVTPEFVKELLDAQQIVVSKKLDHVALDHVMLDWGNADTLRIQGDTFVVSDTSFWFKGYPKHCSYAVEARMIDIDLLLNVIKDPQKYCNSYCAFADGVLFYDGAGVHDFALTLLDEGVVGINEGTIDQMPR